MASKEKIATSATVEGLTKLINEYFYSTTCRIEGAEVHNSKGKIEGFEVEQKKGKFIFKNKVK